MSLVTDEIRKSASEIYHGHEICQEKSKFLLTEVGLPNGLLPLQDIQECGYVKETGFVWLIQKKKCEHKFQKIGKLVQYATEVTAYVEPNKIKKLTGVKTKELLLWITLSDISVDDPPTGKITFRTPAGLFRSFPVSAFEIEVEEKEKEKEKENAAVVKDNAEVMDAKATATATATATAPAAAAAAAVEVKEARPLLEEKALSKLVDSCLGCCYSETEVQAMMHCAALCLHRDPQLRPRMSQVLQMLEGDAFMRRSV